MFFYDKTPKQMLVDLINEGNPDLPFAINATDYEFKDPTAISETPEGHNTSIRLYAHPTAPYMGNIILTYRRLHLDRLFWGLMPRIQKWFPGSDDTGNNSTQIATLYDILPLFSKQYGLLLDESQINNVGMKAYYGANEGRYYTMTASADSLIYTGSTLFNWMSGRRGLDDVVTDDETQGILYPGGNDFSDLEARKLYMTPITYDHDFTLDYDNAPYQNYWANYSGQRLGISNSSYDRAFQQWWDAFADVFEARTGTRPTYVSNSNQYNNYKTIPFDFTGFVVMHSSLPTSNWPEANSDHFNRVTVIKCPEDCPWATGYIYIHYNV